MLRKKVRKVGDCAGIFMQYYAKAQHGQKEAKIRTAMSNVYKRSAGLGTHHHHPAIDAYKKKFGVCDLFNRQIKHRLWPHKHFIFSSSNIALLQCWARTTGKI